MKMLLEIKAKESTVDGNFLSFLPTLKQHLCHERLNSSAEVHLNFLQLRIYI